MHETLETLSADADRLQRHFEAFLDELDVLPLDSLGLEFRSNLLKNSVLMLAKLTAVRKTLVALRVHTDSNFYQWKRLGAGLLAMEHSLDELRAQAHTAVPAAAHAAAASRPSPQPSAATAPAPVNAPSPAAPAAPIAAAASVSPAPSRAATPAPAPAPRSAASTSSAVATSAPAPVTRDEAWFESLYAYASEADRPRAVIPAARFRGAVPADRDPRFATAADFNFATLADIYGPPLSRASAGTSDAAEFRAALRRAARTLPTLPHPDAPDFPARFTALIHAAEADLAHTRRDLRENCSPAASTPESTDEVPPAPLSASHTSEPSPLPSAPPAPPSGVSPPPRGAPAPPG